jgi:anti-anti-sigma regulatory factor
LTGSGAGRTLADEASEAAAMMGVTHGVHGEVVIHIDGNFDASEARRLSGWLVEVPSGQPLVLDFTQVKECEDFGLAAVARDLAARDRLVVRGLTRHHERMLKYCGVKLESLPAEPGDDQDAVG